ncbi:MAG: hypothetical protein GXO80_06005 [Chlorobi bacterium]|nr:hypothetical protein [Chlorobiota bacterium]
MKAFFNTLFRTFYREPKSHRVFFMKTENILNTDSDKAGVIIEVQHDPKYKFEEIILTEKPEIETVQKGMISVTQDLVLKFSNPGHIFNDLNALKDNKKGISILQLSPNNQAYLYGENKGLQIIKITKDTLILEGEEANTFFNVDFETALKIIESKS